jgi:acetyl/propionyl-CoA carboxylase alpha subunit
MARIERGYLWKGEKRQVQAEIEGDRLYLEMNGRAWTFNIAPGPPGTFVLTDGDRVHTGYAVASNGAIWVQLDGRTWVVERERPSRAPGGPHGPTGGDVIAPMTGTVRKVFVTAGEAVSAGAPLLVVEAMKMEFTVTAPGDGRVAAVLCAPGQTVDLGQILVHFEPVGMEEP